jgi:Cu/Ag efflux protein CusF
MFKIINKFPYFILATLLLMLAGCSSDDVVSGLTNASGLKFSITDQGMTSVSTFTRATIDSTTMTTTFEVGDEVGVFGVKDGKVVSGINNLKLTYNSNGFWTAESSVDYSTDLDGVTFYGYYPYSADMEFDASLADPFATTVVNEEISSQQSTQSLFNTADLMTSSGATVDATYHSVTLVMNHRNALVNIELPNSSYVFTNADPYVLTKASNVSFKKGDETINPYFDESGQVYRFIISANDTSSITVSFTNNEKTHHAMVSTLYGIGAGQYAEYVIDGGVSLTMMTLQVGDYYLSDGRLVSKGSVLTDAQKEKVIGIVYKLGTTDAIAESNSSCTHAMVVGTTTYKGKWGNIKGSTTSDENTAGWKTWYTDYGLSDLGTTTASKIDMTTLAATGYESTQNWRKVPVDLTYGSYTIDMVRGFQTADSIQSAIGYTDVSTSWFVPSLYEWEDISATATVVEESLSACGGTALGFPMTKPGYHSSNIRSAATTWTYLGGGSVAAKLFNGNSCSTPAFYRWVLAF